MFKSTVQPPIVSLFSSTGSEPLGIWSKAVDKTKPDLSLIQLLNDTTSERSPTAPGSLVAPPCSENHGYLLDQTVLHIQGPDLRKTYIQCPPNTGSARDSSSASRLRDDRDHDQHGSHSSRGEDLGIRHHCVHFQVRNLGKDWSFEVGVMDQTGREGILRFSTFQTSPRLNLGKMKAPLLHLPLAFPSSSPQLLTHWATINLHLPTYMAYFSSHDLQDNFSDSNDGLFAGEGIRYPVPKGLYSHVSYICVYGTCRLRRIWFDNDAHNQQLPWEFQLYSKQ